jgi:hypothetical protein
LSLPPLPLVNPNVQITPVYAHVQSSHASKRLKTDIPDVKDKGKAAASPSSPSNDSSKSVSSHMHLKDDCPMLLVRYNLKVRINQRLLPGSQRGTSMIKEILPLRVASMDFNLCVFMIELLKTLVCRKFGQQAFFWIMWIFTYFWI